MTGTPCWRRSRDEGGAPPASGPPGPRPWRLPHGSARPPGTDGGVPAARTAAGGPRGAPAPCGALRLRLLPGRRRTAAAPDLQARPAPGGGEPARPGAPEPSPAAADEAGLPHRVLAPGRPGVRRVAGLALGGARDPALVPPPVRDGDRCRPGDA